MDTLAYVILFATLLGALARLLPDGKFKDALLALSIDLLGLFKAVKPNVTPPSQ